MFNGWSDQITSLFFEILDYNNPNKSGLGRSSLIFSINVKLRGRGRFKVKWQSDQTKNAFFAIFDWNYPK